MGKEKGTLNVRDRDRDQERDREKEGKKSSKNERKTDSVTERDKERDRGKDSDRSSGRHGISSRDKDKVRDKDREKDKGRDRDRDRDRDVRDREREKEKERRREKERIKEDEEKERERKRRKRDEIKKEESKTIEADKVKETPVSEDDPKHLSAAATAAPAVSEPEESEADAEQRNLDEEMERRRRRVQEWQERRRKEKEEAEGLTGGNGDQKTGETAGSAEDTMDGSRNADGKKTWTLDGEDSDEETDAAADVAADVEENQDGQAENGHAKMEEAEDDVDPLDAFMNSITLPPPVPVTTVSLLDASARTQGRISGSKTRVKSQKRSGIGRIMGGYDTDSDSDEGSDGGEGAMAGEEEDDAEFLRRMSERGSKIDKLPAVDHSAIDYPPFRKNFYIQVKEIERMSDEQVAQYRAEHEFKLRGKDVPKPVRAWTQVGLNHRVMEVIKKQGWVAPMPIQAQALPIIMSGRDCIGIAKTGSGKTMAFVLPMLRHILDQPDLEAGDGPIGMVLAPTRELVHQIHTDIRKFTKSLGLSVVAVYGGGGVAAQIGELKRGAHIVVCTPGRMIDILCTGTGKITNLRRVTYLVMDEADRMFDMGFEPQITRMVQNTRPDRQTVLFSATFPRQVEVLAKKVLTRPIEIQVGGRSVVNKDISQTVEVRSDGEERFLRLLELLGNWYDKGKILVFVHSQDRCDSLYKDLLSHGYPCLSLHGAKDQTDRESTLADFKANVCSVMIATSVAARGLDVKDLQLVVNYDVPNHYEDYVHRVGRTGRAGNKGQAVTFVAPDEDRYAPDLVKALQLSEQPVPEDLRAMADGFNLKVKAGQVQTHGSGYGGSGFKFNEEEEEGRKALKKAQAKEYGVEAEESDSESDSEGIRRVEGPMGGGGAPTGAGGASSQIAAAQAAAMAAAAKAGLTPGTVTAVPAPLTAQQQIQALVSQRLAAAGLGGVVGQSTAGAGGLVPGAGLGMLGLVPGVGIGGLGLIPGVGNEGASKAAAFAAALNLQHSLQKLQEVTPEHFEAEYEINDFPPHARWKLMHKETLGQISDWTGAAITTRGQHYPIGKHPPAGEKKLYLFIEGPSVDSVRKAKIEIKRVLEDAAAYSSASQSGGAHQPGKYTL